MNRYVIARVSASVREPGPTSPASSEAPVAELLELAEVDRRAFFRICFHMARNVPRPARSRGSHGDHPVPE